MIGTGQAGSEKRGRQSKGRQVDSLIDSFIIICAKMRSHKSKRRLRKIFAMIHGGNCVRKV